MYRNREHRDFARSLRNQPTEAERRLWRYLRSGKMGVKFRRQAAFGPYIVDFVCFSHRLIIELDGPQHLDARSIEYDKRRDEWLIKCGFRVIRLRNHVLDECIWQVVDDIQRALREIGRPVGSSLGFPRQD